MTLPTSGVITLNEIATEFGGPTPHVLKNYYRGGTYVPNSTTNANIPTSGTISLNNFYGASNVIPFKLVTTMNSGGGNQIFGYAGTTFPFNFTSTFGALSPNTYLGYTLTHVFTEYTGNPGYTFYVCIGFGTTYPPQNIFTQVSFTGNSGAETFTSASAVYSQIFNNSNNQNSGVWSWDIGYNFFFTHGTNYTITFT